MSFPDPSGLRLNFLLEPAYYLGIINFPQTAKLFSYTRLLRVVNLPDEDPYDKARVALAQEALQKFLQHNGYFQATVQTDAQIDDDHQLVNLTFSATLGKLARVGNVSFQGPDAGEDARLLRSIRSLRARFSGGPLKPGKPYMPARIAEATGLIRRTLSQQHHLASQVREIPPQYHADTNRVDVSFKVDVGPVVTVHLTGARLSLFPFVSARERKKLIPIYSEGTIDRDLVDEGQQNLVDYFQKKGYFDVQVKITFQRQPDQILLVYQVKKGRKYKVDRIVFQGNHEISEKDLLPVVVVTKSHILWHGSLSQKLLKQSATNIAALYRDRGYEDVKVTSRSADSIIASQAASQLSSGVQKFAGVSSLQINPLLGGNSQNPSAQVALQQRVTKNFLFTFSTDVSQPGQEIVQGDYQINEKWSVSVERDQLGGVSVDGRYHTKF